MSPEPYTTPVAAMVSRFTVVRYADGQPDSGKAGLRSLADAIDEAHRPVAKLVDRLERTDGELPATGVAAAITIGGFTPVLWLEAAYLPPPPDTPGRFTPPYREVLDRGGSYTVTYTDSDQPEGGLDREVLLPSVAFAVEVAFDRLGLWFAGLRGSGARAGHPWQVTATVGLHEHTVARLLCRYQPPPLDLVPTTDPAFRTALTLAPDTRPPRNGDEQPAPAVSLDKETPR